MALIVYCPFYRREERGVISCEYGTLRPPDKMARDEIIFNYCASMEGFKKCPFRLALEHYYARKYAKEDKHGTTERPDT